MSTSTMPARPQQSRATPPKTGTLAPHTPLRPATAVTGTPASLQAASTAATSAGVVGPGDAAGRAGTWPRARPARWRAATSRAPPRRGPRRRRDLRAARRAGAAAARRRRRHAGRAGVRHRSPARVEGDHRRRLGHRRSLARRSSARVTVTRAPARRSGRPGPARLGGRARARPGAGRDGCGVGLPLRRTSARGSRPHSAASSDGRPVGRVGRRLGAPRSTARVRRTRTSSTVRAISSRAAQTASTARYGSPATSGSRSSGGRRPGPARPASRCRSDRRGAASVASSTPRRPRAARRAASTRIEPVRAAVAEPTVAVGLPLAPDSDALGAVRRHATTASTVSSAIRR